MNLANLFLGLIYNQRQKTSGHEKKSLFQSSRENAFSFRLTKSGKFPHPPEPQRSSEHLARASWRNFLFPQKLKTWNWKQTKINLVKRSPSRQKINKLSEINRSFEDFTSAEVGNGNTTRDDATWALLIKFSLNFISCYNNQNTNMLEVWENSSETSTTSR